MIRYQTAYFGLPSLLRVHGSAVFKNLFPAGISSLILYLYDVQDFIKVEQFNAAAGAGSDQIVEHPYMIGALIAFFSFLLTFRLNFAYGRYWEAATAVHQMQSKWLDVAMNMAAFHYQAAVYDAIKPNVLGGQERIPILTSEPSNHPNQVMVGRDRQFECKPSMESIRMAALQQEKHEEDTTSNCLGLRRRRNKTPSSSEQPTHGISNIKNVSSKGSDDDQNDEKNAALKKPSATNSMDATMKFHSQFRLKIDDSQHHHHDSMSPAQALPSTPPTDTTPMTTSKQYMKQQRAKMPLVPSMFLQESMHLISLMSAVAMSTLRNDVEGMEAPLMEYIPGKPLPPVDPDAEVNDGAMQIDDEQGGFWRVLYFCLGLPSHSVRHRTLYHAVRPFGVLGGVSDGEVRVLQAARGPHAKVALVTMWLQEFISRESGDYKTKSTGKVAPQLISRLYQFISDGMVGYNQARKIAYVPFPFVHAQMTAFFSLVIIFIFPVLFSEFIRHDQESGRTSTEMLWFALIMNYITVLSFLGIHEVARELESPFFNPPNDIPLVTFQAQFNEALVTAYAGYNPDAWWTMMDKASTTSATATEDSNDDDKN